MTTPRDLLTQCKDAIRNPFCFPGGYTKAIYLSDGEQICNKCARENYKEIARATIDEERNGWAVMAVQVHWEGPADICCQCNKELPSEYGDPNEEEPEDTEPDLNAVSARESYVQAWRNKP